MVSLVGDPQYQETSLDGEYFKPNHDKIYLCYKHIVGAAVVTCDYSNYDEFLFGKHREWFCKFRNGRCLHKCHNCEELHNKCLETEDCRHNEEDLEKKEKKKSFFSMFSKKADNVDDESNQKQTEDIVSNHKSHQTEQSEEIQEETVEKKPVKKSFFSIFGHDEEELKIVNQVNQDVETEPKDNESHNDASSVVSLNETTMQEIETLRKKKSFFSKFSKKDLTKDEDHEHTETKWHDESSDEELEDKKPKKKSFFSRFSKRDLTKDSDSENEQNNMKETEHSKTEDEQEEHEEDKKKKKKSFFSRFSKKDVTKDTDSENEEVDKQNNLEQVELHENKLEEEHDDKKENKKNFFNKFTKEEVKTEETLQEFLEGCSDTYQDGHEIEKEEKKKKDKKRSLFSSSSKNEEVENKLEHEDNVSENQTDIKKEKKKSFFSMFSKKAHKEEKELENEIDAENKKSEDSKEDDKNDENEIHDDTNIQTENQDEITENDTNKPIKKERRKSFLAIFTKKDESDLNDNEEIESIETNIKDEIFDNKILNKKEQKKTEIDNENNHSIKLTRKRSFLSKSKQNLTKDKEKQEFEVYKTKSFENCEVCFTKFKNCPNNCYNCYTRIEEFNWFDHFVLNHTIMMSSREYEDKTVAFYLQTEFNKKMQFCFTAYDYTFFFDFIFSSGEIMINMVTNMNDYACKYFTCNYTVSWLDTDISEELRFEAKEFWDWNVHTILTDKIVDDKFFDKCKLVIKIVRI